MKIEMIGRTFARLTVLSQHKDRGADGGLKWVCRCECGNECVVAGGHLRFGQTKSCGCLKHEHSVEMGRSGRTHGLTDSGTYTSWVAMKSRCTNPTNPSYPDYGARGISVCDAWRNSFDQFLADMGKRPEGTSIDRINTDGNYEPGNCHWASLVEQANNKKSNVRFEIDGESMTMAEACRCYGASYMLVCRRIRNGVPPHIALTTPAGALPKAYTRWSAARASKMEAL